MSKKFWIVSRPKRKLIIVPELLKVFSAVALGKPWRGNRDLQKEFEQQLVNFGWKAQNLSIDGSGSRTYAALLSMLGLWYEDDDGVKLTQAGKEIISGEPAVRQLTKQLINFQYPSPYSKVINIDESFKLQPHRFVISTLFDERIEFLSQDELAFCIIPFAKQESDLNSCIDRILRYRENPEEIKSEAIRLADTTEDNLSNIANTVINQLEYTQFFKYREELNAPLEFEADGASRARNFIDQYGRSFSGQVSDKVLFQKRYGSGINTTKDYSDTNPLQPDTNPIDRLILIKFYELAQEKPIFGISQNLIDNLSREVGVRSNQVQRVLSKIANQPLLDNFEERYINLSKGGTETATEFEKVTTNVFGVDGFGLDAEWVGSKGTYPDIFVYINKAEKIHGIVDTKAYKEYALGIDQRNKMAHTYVPNFSTVEHEGEDYNIVFFAYVAGGFKSTIQQSYEILKNDIKAISGSYITSLELMKLLRKHRQEAYAPEDLLRIFTIDKEIIFDEVNR